MKNLFLSIILILFCTYSNAQNSQSNSGKLQIEIINGISLPNGGFEDFVEDGFNSELSLSKQFCEKISLGFGAKHSSFNVKQEFGPVQGSRNQYTSTTFDVGPQLNIGNSKFAIQVYGRTGLSVTSTPEIKSLQANTDITTEKLNQQSVKALSARVGAKIKTEVCTGLQLFVSSEYVTTLNSDINFYSKDLSKAIGADGRIDPDLASEIPFTAKSLNFSSLNMNFGVSISIGSLCANNSQRSSNPLHQNSGTKGDNPMYQPRSSNNSNPMYQQNSNQGENVLYEGANNSGGNTGGNNRGVEATDYNSSRSNKADSATDTSGDDGNNDGSKATDYNSSRSNKNSNHSVLDVDNNGGNNRGVEATDYNSSRSNKADTATDTSGDDGNNDGSKATDYNSSRSNKNSNHSALGMDNNGGNNRGVEATDYNSSRSNKADTATDTSGDDGNNDGSKATDYNSSRSNKNSNHSALGMDNNGGNNRGVEATDYNSSRSNKQGIVAEDSSGDDGNNDGNKATDYNLSRSNKADTAMDASDDIRVSMTQAQKRKMKKKLKREERARLKKEKLKEKEDKKKRKAQANSIY